MHSASLTASMMDENDGGSGAVGLGAVGVGLAGMSGGGPTCGGAVVSTPRPREAAGETSGTPRGVAGFTKIEIGVSSSIERDE